MKAVASAVLAALLFQDPDVCDHGSRGAIRPVDLREVGRNHDEMARAFESLSVPRAATLEFLPFDSGIPACRARTTRRIRVQPLPSEMKPLFFAPEHSDVPEGYLHVTTRARSLKGMTLPGDRELAERFGVRCAPTAVKFISTEEVELTEGGAP